MKEIFFLAYLPARLVKGKDRWYILFYQTDPKTGDWKRFRPTYNLNRILNIKERTRLGNRIVKEVNKLLPEGWPLVDQSDPMNTNILAAYDWLENVK